MGDTAGKGPQSAPKPVARPTTDDLREQRAIAAAMLIGEELRREDRRQVYWYVKRFGVFIAGCSFFMLLVLFALWRVRPEFNPTFWMLTISAVGAAGVAMTYWAFAEDRRHREP
jgi:hypothetical protein